MQTLKEIVQGLTENKLNKLKERIKKADVLKKNNKKEFDKHLFQYCKLKANISFVDADVKTSAFWHIAIELINRIADAKVFDTKTLSKFIEDLEKEVKTLTDVNVLYSIVNQLMLEYLDRLGQMQK